MVSLDFGLSLVRPSIETLSIVSVSLTETFQSHSQSRSREIHFHWSQSRLGLVESIFIGLSLVSVSKKLVSSMSETCQYNCTDKIFSLRKIFSRVFSRCMYYILSDIPFDVKVLQISWKPTSLYRARYKQCTLQRR